MKALAKLDLTIERPHPYLPRVPKPMTIWRETVILLAEDDDELRFAMECVLLSIGYRVIPAANAQLAFAAFYRYSAIDLLMTDFEMPGLSGLELARIVANTRRDLPVLFVSGGLLEDCVQREIQNQGWSLLSKPVQIGTLRSTLRSLLKTTRRQQLVRPESASTSPLTE